MKDKAIEKIKNNYNKSLLLNIFIDDDKSNILICIKEEEYLIVAINDEKNYS